MLATSLVILEPLGDGEEKSHKVFMKGLHEKIDFSINIYRYLYR